jgi:hypothetical protein
MGAAKGLNAQAFQIMASNPQAFAAMAANPQAFAALAAQPQALAAFSRNAQAFQVLGHQPAFHALVMNASFAAAARSQNFANALNTN